MTYKKVSTIAPGVRVWPEFWPASSVNGIVKVATLDLLIYCTYIHVGLPNVERSFFPICLGTKTRRLGNLLGIFDLLGPLPPCSCHIPERSRFSEERKGPMPAGSAPPDFTYVRCRTTFFCPSILGCVSPLISNRTTGGHGLHDTPSPHHLRPVRFGPSAQPGRNAPDWIFALAYGRPRRRWLLFLDPPACYTTRGSGMPGLFFLHTLFFPATRCSLLL